MRTIINNSKNPHFNLALEEYLLKNFELDDDFILLWQNNPSVIIGRNQITIEEINSRYVKEKEVNVVRRISGGGAVYHDHGNLNFTFITKYLKDRLNNYKIFTKPVINLLNELGAEAEFSEPNGITIDEKKISGNAQTYYKSKMLHHGTILFDSDLKEMDNVLDVKLKEFNSKGVKSIPSSVSNILPHLDEPITIKEFKDRLLKFILKTNRIDSHIYELKDDDFKVIYRLMKNKYSSWDWNYGQSPEFDLTKTGHYDGVKVDIRLKVNKGRIQDCNIYADSYTKQHIQKLVETLKGKRFEEASIRKSLKQVNFNEHFFKVSVDKFINCLFN